VARDCSILAGGEKQVFQGFFWGGGVIFGPPSQGCTIGHAFGMRKRDLKTTKAQNYINHIFLCTNNTMYKHTVEDDLHFLLSCPSFILRKDRRLWT